MLQKFKNVSIGKLTKQMKLKFIDLFVIAFKLKCAPFRIVSHKIQNKDGALLPKLIFGTQNQQKHGAMFVLVTLFLKYQCCLSL